MRNTFACLLFVAGCGTTSITYPPGDGGASGSDINFNFDFAGQQASCDDQHPCPPGRRCYDSMCIPDNGTCANDDECQNDTYCDCTGGGGADAGPCVGGVCVPWGTGPRG